MITPAKSKHASLWLPDDACSCDAPSVTPCSILCPSMKDDNALTHNQLCALWHMHLGYVNKRLVLDLHKYVDGIPALPHSDILHSCPMCTQAKFHKANYGDTNTTEATDCWQDIQIFWCFHPMLIRRIRKKKPQSKQCKESCKM